jgi:hypothetical protein
MEASPICPIYGDAPTKPGLYLGLLHGRHDPKEQMNEWGFNGPLVGPLKWVHTTYLHDIKIEFETELDAAVYFKDPYPSVQLDIRDDLLIFQNKYYGDWTVFYVSKDECKRPTDTFRTVQRLDLMPYKHSPLKSSHQDN